MWCIPAKSSAEFVCHMEDVLDVYHRPYDPSRPVVRLDETSKQLIGEVRESLPPAPGRVERYDSVYVRNGVANLFLAFEPLGGRRHVAVTDTRTRRDWAHSARDLIDGRYREAEKVVLVMDQLDTHSVASLYEAFVPEEAERVASRLEVPHTRSTAAGRTWRRSSRAPWGATCPSASGRDRRWWNTSRPGKIDGTATA